MNLRLLPRLVSLSSRCRSARRAGGFTLIEILVVLVIVSIFATLATLSIEGVEGRRNEEEVGRLRRLLEMANDYTDTHGTPLAVDLLPNGYRFSTLDTSGEWKLIFAPSPFAERSWGEDVGAAGLSIDGKAVEQPWRIVFNGNEPPEYTISLNTPNGAKKLSGRVSGAVELE